VSVINLPAQPGLDLFNTILAVNDTIPVGINPRGLATDRSSRFTFVVNVGDETMSVIDSEAGTVIDTKFVGFGPDEVAVGPDGTAYVTARGDGTVTVVRPPR
jgi:DNA-binding beta-propeller fold protein YncE